MLYYVSDVLIYRGRNLLKEPLASRRELLSNVVPNSDPTPIRVSQNLEANSVQIMRIVREFGFEGIIAKRKDSQYESGKRTGAWSKYKVNRGQEFVVGGYSAGNPFDALIVGYYDGGKLYYVAKVRNGFVPRVRQEVYRRFKGLEIDTCLFVNLPEKRRTQWH